MQRARSDFHDKALRTGDPIAFRFISLAEHPYLGVAMHRPGYRTVHGSTALQTGGGAHDEPDQPPGHLGGGWLPGSLAERHDAHQHGATRPALISHDPCPG